MSDLPPILGDDRRGDPRSGLQFGLPATRPALAPERPAIAAAWAPVRCREVARCRPLYGLPAARPVTVARSAVVTW
jgi:hypothetical protein